MSTRLRRIARSGLNQLGLTRKHQPITSETQRDEYWHQVVATYAHPLSRPREDFSVLEQLEAASENADVKSRFDNDREVMIRSILRRVYPEVTVKSDGTTSLSDIVGIVESRYAAGDGPQLKLGRAVLQALAALSAGDPLLDWSLLPDRLSEVLGESSIRLGTEDGKVNQRIDGPDVIDQDRTAIIGSILDRVIEEGFIPRFYDYDYLDDIVPIVESRYVANDAPQPERGRAVLQALCAMSAGDPLLDWSLLPGRLREVLGEKHHYVPPRGSINPYVSTIIPDLVEEFIALRAEDNVERFLEINREYSARQHTKQGDWDNRDLSLLRGYERNHHLLLRTLVGLIRDGKISHDDEALVLGPRHIDELNFFQKHLGLQNTVGLDLFESYGGRIVAGDMHDMPFESNRFRVVFSAGTLSYAYNVRKVINEIARVLKRPGYVFLIDASERVPGPDPLGRSDIGSVGSAIRCFYKHRSRVIAQDPGRSLDPLRMKHEPCFALELY